jgi:hypothetical protein
MTSPIYTPANWYWIVAGSTTQVWSSAATAYVAVTDATYQAWLAAGNVPTPIDSEASLAQVLALRGLPTGALVNPFVTCQLWQLESVMTPAQWAAVQSAVAALANPAVTAFFAHGTNQIPANSTTLLALAAGLTPPLTPAQVTALVAAASAISVP